MTIKIRVTKKYDYDVPGTRNMMEFKPTGDDFIQVTRDQGEKIVAAGCGEYDADSMKKIAEDNGKK